MLELNASDERGIEVLYASQSQLIMVAEISFIEECYYSSHYKNKKFRMKLI